MKISFVMPKTEEQSNSSIISNVSILNQNNENEKYYRMNEFVKNVEQISKRKAKLNRYVEFNIAYQRDTYKYTIVQKLNETNFHSRQHDMYKNLT